jgi:hypothetical protein
MTSKVVAAVHKSAQGVPALLTESSACPIASTKASCVRAPILRKIALTLENACSMGEKSGK